MAFSGGTDSTALAAGLAPLARERGLELCLGHVDHGLDADSGRRAGRARELADRIGLPFTLLERDVGVERRRRESPEAAARRVRYGALEAERERVGATRILTAHQRDDQVETLLLRLLAGGPVEELTGIAARRGVLLRPLLGVGRAEIERFLADEHPELAPVEDPTNRDPRVPRNRVRAALLPHLRRTEPEFEPVLLALAERAARLRKRLEATYSRLLTEASSEGGREIEAASLLRLPEQLRPGALRWFLRARSVRRLPSSPSLEAFLRALAASRRGRAALRLPGGERELVAASGRIRVAPVAGAGAEAGSDAGAESPGSPFSYTCSMPGEVELTELGLRFRIRRSGVEPWMLRGDPQRAALALDAAAAPTATVRSRRPGDRMRPLGGPGERKLKALLIDRKVPARERDRLPILEIGGRIAWVPGVTIDDRFRLGGAGTDCWLVELEPLESGGNGPDAGPVGMDRKESR